MTAYAIISIVVFFILLIFFGFYRFQSSVLKEKESMFNQYGKVENTIAEADLEGLPSLLKSYLEKVGIKGKCKDCHVILKQSGKIKTALKKKWTSFTATQYMTASFPNFIWSAQSFPMFIRDKSVGGKGEVKVSLFGLKDIAKSDGYKTNESALARYLGELMLYPIGFLSSAITWETLDANSLKATAQVNGTIAEGIFYLNPAGLFYRFEAKRYKGETLENFTGIAEDYKMMGGLYIPSKMRAIWNLGKGDFEYFNSTITSYRID